MFPAAKSLFPTANNYQEIPGQLRCRHSIVCRTECIYIFSDNSLDQSWVQNKSYHRAEEEPLPSKRSRDDRPSSDSSLHSGDSSEDLPSIKHYKRGHKRSKKKKKHRHKQKKEKQHEKTYSSMHTSTSEPQKPATIWLEETSFTPKDAYRLDPKPDLSNLSYDALYTGDVTNYQRRFGNYCLGLNGDGIKFSDQRNQMSKKRKHLPKESRYYDSKISEASNTVFLLEREAVLEKTNEKEDLMVDEFLVINSVSSRQEEDSEISPETYLMQKASQYNTQLLDEPHNVQLWVEFIRFQDESLVWGKLPVPAVPQDAAAAGNKATESLRHQRIALIERKIAIYERALESNPLSEELLVGHMELVQEIWEVERLVKQWKDIVFKQPNRSLLWLKYIEFCQSRFSFFRSSTVSALYQKAITTLSSILDCTLLSHRPEPEAETRLLVVFVLYCHFLQQSGFPEKSIALFQAMVEFNLCCPSELLANQLLNKTKDRLEIFEAFWDSGVPRVGEKDAQGWRRWWESQNGMVPVSNETTLGVYDLRGCSQLLLAGDSSSSSGRRSPGKVRESESGDEELMDEESILIKDLPSNSAWVRLESHREMTLCLPARLLPNEDPDQEEEDGGDDPDHTVLFDDIAQSLFILRDEDVKVKLVLEFLRFMGVPIREQPLLVAVFPDLVQMMTSPQEVVHPIKVPIIHTASSPCALYQPCSVGRDLATLSETSLHGLLCPAVRSPLEHSPFKVFVTTCCNHCLQLINDLKASQRTKSGLVCAWLQYELDHVLFFQDKSKLVQSKATNLQSLAMALLPIVTISDYHFLWDFIVQLETYLDAKKKSSSLSKCLLQPFTVSPQPYGSPCFCFCLLFVEYMLKLRKPMNCYSKYRPNHSLALFALVSLSLSEFNPTVLPVSDFKVFPAQKVKAADYFKQVSSKLLTSVGNMGAMDIVSRLGCCFYFEYLCKGLESSCQLMKNYMSALSKLDIISHTTFLDCMESLYIIQINLINVHSLTNSMKPQVLRDVLHSALEVFPLHFWFLTAYIQSEEQSFITGQVRRYFNSVTQKGNFVIPCLFAIHAELSRHNRISTLSGESLEEPAGGVIQRVRALFGRCSQSNRGQLCPVLWRLYIKFEVIKIHYPLK